MEQNDLLTEIRRTGIEEIFKLWIRTTYPEPLATYYCQQVEDATTCAKILEQLFKNR